MSVKKLYCCQGESESLFSAVADNYLVILLKVSRYQQIVYKKFLLSIIYVLIIFIVVMYCPVYILRNNANIEIKK